MALLEDTVSSVVKNFILTDKLFTALDVSNEVRKAMPNSRHREVRDVVRALFTTEIETSGWAKTPITVKLFDGSTAEALLYHPLADIWDLDSKYDAQMRAQTAVQPVAQAQAVVVQAQLASAPPAPTAAVPVVLANTQPAAMPTTPFPTARTLWDNMFKKNPSLFPLK